MRRLAATIGLGLLASCGSPETNDFYLSCSIPEQGTFPEVEIDLQVRPRTGTMLELQDGVFRDVCYGKGFECGKVMISDSLITQSITYPDPDGGRPRRQDFRLDRQTGAVTYSYYDSAGNSGGVWNGTCEQRDEPPVKG